MAQKRLILHLGTPKTGTTSLQNTLVAEEERLARLDVRYLKSYRAAINHNRLTMQLSKGGEVAKRIVRKLRQELDHSDEHTLLISTEIAYGLKPTSLLLEAIGAERLGTAEIMIYVRRQDLLLEAMAKQKLKSGHYKGSMEKFISARKHVGRYMSYISNVQRRFPGVPISCRPYDRKELVDGDIVADFWQFLDIRELPKTASTASSANKTPSRELAIALSRQEFATPQHRRKVIADIQNSHSELFKSKDILDASARRSFQEEFREENRVLGSFCGRDIEALFNDDVDYAAESNPVENPEEREALFKRALDTVRETAFRHHPNQQQEVKTDHRDKHKRGEQ